MYDPQGNRYDMMNGSGWMTGFALLSMLLLLIAVIAVLTNLYLHVSAGRSSARSPVSTSGAGPTSALPEARLTLDGRLARGDVAPEEYQTLRSLLDG